MDHLSLPNWSVNRPRSSASSRCSFSSTRSSGSSLLSRSMYKVLVLSATLEQAEEVHAVISSGKYTHIEFRYPSTLSHAMSGFDSMYKDCCDVIRDEEVDVIVSVHPGLELLHAALLKEFTHLKGPTFESVFVALHRHYSKEIACEGFSVFSKTVNIDEYDDRKLDTILEETASPALVREAYTFEDSFSKKIRNCQVLLKEKTSIRLILEERRREMESFIPEYLNTARYDKCLDLCYTVEEYIKPGKHTGSLHLVEACVVEGVVVPWAICDIGLFKQRPVVARHISCPSQLDDSMKYNVWAVYREVAQRLIAIGLDNQFLQMEIFVGINEMIRVLNLTPSLNRANISLYRHVLLNGDSLLAQIDAGLGRMPREPHVIPQRCAMRATVSSQVYNIPMGELVDLNMAKTLDGFKLLKTRADHVIEQEDSDEDGVHIADVHVSEGNFKACLLNLKAHCSKAIKDWTSSKRFQSTAPDI